jgi:hypothetical protein
LGENNIPKIIHYCWFGGKEKPPIIKKCIDSWKKYLTDYEMIEWNEQNFDIKSNPYIEEAYESKKFAFVSDYVRVHALYDFGGIYLDTDVEVFKSFNDLLHHESFWGFEQENFIATSTIGAAKGNHLIKQFLDSYQEKKFINEDGTYDDFTNVAAITRMLKKLGLVPNGEYQEIGGAGVFYPQTYFSPYDYINCRTFKSDKTYTMHHFYKSWLPLKTRVKGKIKFTLSKVIGGHNIAKLRKILG